MNNKQRKGQWLYNYIEKQLLDESRRAPSEAVLNRLWNMNDIEFDKIMSEQQKVGVVK